MHRSHRGLAASAVSALVLTGLTAAMPAAHAAGPSVRLLSQANRQASTRYDGDDFAISLAARVGDPGAAVTFELNRDPEATDTDPGWTDLALSVAGYDESFSTVWDGYAPGGSSLVGERVALRAKATNGGGTTYSRRNNVEIGDVADAANLDDNSGFRIFAQPYVSTGHTRSLGVAFGTTSASSGTVDLAWWRPSSHTFAGHVAAQVEPDVFKTGPGNFVEGGVFSGVLDVTGLSDLEAYIDLAATRGSDDVVPLAVVHQAINTVTAVSSGDVTAGKSATVTVTVLDASSRPVVGAEVRRSSNGSLVGYTGAEGTVQASQAGGTSETYYANATDADEYDNAQGDRISSMVTVNTYVPAATSIAHVFYDGSVFDIDEAAPGDVVVVVKDQHNDEMAGVSVDYRVYPTGSVTRPRSPRRRPAPTVPSTWCCRPACRRAATPWSRT